MLATITVVFRQDGRRCDIAIDAEPLTPVGRILERIAEATEEAGVAVSASIEGNVLDPQLPFARSPLRDGAVLAVPAERTTGTSARAGVLRLRVVGGPSAGAACDLPPGIDVVVGRGAGATLGLDDPDVSRRHARVRLTDAGVFAIDLGSTNGTFVDGVPLGASGALVPVGSAMCLGSSRLEVSEPDDAPIALMPADDGTLRHNRPPRLQPAAGHVAVTFPACPTAREPTRFSVITLLIPVAVGVALAAIMRRPEYLFFTLLSPALMAGQWLADRRGHRKATAQERAAYEAAIARASAELAAGLAAEEAARRREAPDAESVARIATLPSSRLWERRRTDADFLLLRLGLHDTTARLTVSGDGAPRPRVRAVPLTVSLREVGVLGISGPLRRLTPLAHFLAGQLATLHSPRDLSLVVLTRPSRVDEWDWLRWLPHGKSGRPDTCQVLVGLDADSCTARVAELTTLISARTDNTPRRGDGTSAWSTVVVIVDGARELRDLPGLADVLVRGPRAGVYAICLDIEAASLPEECGASAVLIGEVATSLHVQVSGAEPIPVGIADGVLPGWVERIARALAPIRDGSPGGGADALPDAVRWLEAANVTEHELGAHIAASWSAGPSTRALLGVGDDGPLAIDLTRDGPHGLVAGTTGSGKSELLQTIIAALAVANRPDDFTFVLIDYKGGAAFGACAALPHTVGLVTDLDGGLVERALVSLRAELRRRETLLAEVGARDIDAYRASGQRLARLLIVVDEFAGLAEELPDFVTGLVGVAQRGRSLGVHLLLATQRPEGVVSADIRANTNVRICLAVTREAESRDVLDAPDAAHISRHTPGRAYVRTGHGELRAFQSGRVGGPVGAAVPRAPARAWLSPFTATAGPSRSPGDTSPACERTDLDAIVTACADAARYLDIEAPLSPWLPPLPNVVLLDEVPSTAGVAALGLQDLPAAQARRTLGVALAAPSGHGGFGHLLVAGAPRSGRTTTLRTLAGSLARTHSPAALHLYALDFGGGGLVCLADLPHCGAVATPNEPERIRRLIALVVGEIARRQGLPPGATGNEPHLVVLLDSWESFTAAFDAMEGAAVLDAIQRVLREGAATGVHLVITADRAGLTGRLASSVDARLVLRLPDRNDFALAGVPVAAVPATLPPGRGFWADGAVETQVCLLGPDPSPSGQAAAIAAIAERSRERFPVVEGSARPRRVEPLPTAISLADVATRWPAQPPPRPPGPPQAQGSAICVLGVGGDELAAVRLDLAPSGPGFVVSGPPGSGRSTALATLGCQFAAMRRRVVAVVPRRSPVPDAIGDALTMTVTAPDDPATAGSLAATLYAAGAPCAVLVDDAELVAETAVGAVLDRFAKAARDRGHLLIIAGTPEDLAVGFRGFAVDARRSRCGLVLAPRGPLDGELLGVRLPRAAATGAAITPGRGLLVVRGEMTALQVALPG